MVTDSVQETHENGLFASYFESVISFIWLSFAVIQYADLFYAHAFQVQVFVDGVCKVLLVVLVDVLFSNTWLDILSCFQVTYADSLIKD